MNIKDLIKSSADPEKISLSIKGISVFIPAAVILFQILNVDLNAEIFQEVLDSVANAAVATIAAISAIVTAYGLIRKLFFRIVGNI